MPRRLLVLLAALCLVVVAAPAAAAQTTRKKSMWGPVERNGVSQFPIYQDLGVGIFQMTLDWSEVAPTRPANPDDPNDPAYRWPAEADFAVAEAPRYGIRVSFMATGAPGWANGGRSRRWAPTDPGDFADFVAAASRRYPTVNHWMIWGEPTRRAAFMPLIRERAGQPLDQRRRRAPRLYARILDASYARLKAVSARNLVIGGNSFTTGDVSPFNWIRYLRLPSGRRPRMDMWGHNPFGAREPNLRRGRVCARRGCNYYADFSELDTLARWLDRYQRRGRRIFLSEYFAPTDHRNHEFNFFVNRSTQARWARSALRITRGWSRIYTLGWFSLYDDPPNGPNGTHGDDVHRGLLQYDGERKPSYDAWKDG